MERSFEKKMICILSAALYVLLILPAAGYAAESGEAGLIVDAAVKPSVAGALQVLSIDGVSTLCDKNGNPLQLRGMSTHGLQWFPEVLNNNAFAALSNDWGCNVVRLAMYVGEAGYATDPDVMKQRVIDGIELAKANDMYAMVDWHVHAPGDPNDPVYSGAMDFFEEISDLYPNDPYIIYEIANEPSENSTGGQGLTNDAAGWQKVKAYAEPIVAMLRQKGNHNLIVVGNPAWSQRPDLAADDPIDDPNIAYAFHFYTGSHPVASDSSDRGNIMSNAMYAMEHGAAVFATEWGTSQNTGNNGPYLTEADVWIDFMNANNISWVNWSLTNKNETSGAFLPYEQGAADATSLDPGDDKVWAVQELSVSGEYVRARIKGIPYEPIDRVSYSNVLWNFDDGTTQGFAPNRDNPKKDIIVSCENNMLKITGLNQSNDITDWNFWANLRISADSWGNTVNILGAKELTIDVIADEPTTVAIAAVPQGGATEWVNPSRPGFVLPEDFQEQPDGTYKAVLTILPGDSPALETIAMHLTDNSMTNVVLFIGAENTDVIYLDNITVSGEKIKIEALHDEKGTAALPSDFEDGTRQGWDWAVDSGVKSALTIKDANGSRALSWEFRYPAEKPEDLWASAPRLDLWIDNLTIGDYEWAAFDLYIKPKRASKGAIEVNMAFQPPEFGYWVEAANVNTFELAEFETKEKTADGLYHYEIVFNISDMENIKKDTILRNMIVVFEDIESDFVGTMYVDNVRFGSGEFTSSMTEPAETPAIETPDAAVNDEDAGNDMTGLPATAIYILAGVLALLAIGAVVYIIIRRKNKKV